MRWDKCYKHKTCGECASDRAQGCIWYNDYFTPEWSCISINDFFSHPPGSFVDKTEQCEGHNCLSCVQSGREWQVRSWDSGTCTQACSTIEENKCFTTVQACSDLQWKDKLDHACRQQSDCWDCLNFHSQCTWVTNHYCKLKEADDAVGQCATESYTEAKEVCRAQKDCRACVTAANGRSLCSWIDGSQCEVTSDYLKLGCFTTQCRRVSDAEQCPDAKSGKAHSAQQQTELMFSAPDYHSVSKACVRLKSITVFIFLLLAMSHICM